MSAQRRLHAFGHDLERAVDALRARLKERSGGYGPLEVLAYRGHAGRRGLVLRGRVLEERGLGPPREADSVWRNLLATYRRFETDEVAGVRVRIVVEGRVHETTTDGEGYFLFRLPDVALSAPASGWLPVPVHVPGSKERGIPEARTTGLARVPGRRAGFGVISDVDDTVLRSEVRSLLTTARLTLLHTAHTRLPFEGVAALYRALEAGRSTPGRNPIFYVSSSPWNLYDLLADFMELQRIPAGPLFLQDLGVDERKLLSSSHADHKVAMIEEILEVHPDLPFVLLGDSGQRDPEVYREVVRLRPGRVQKIYIRHVSTSAPGERVREIAAELAREGVEMVLARDSLEVAEHAAAGGLIEEESLPAVRATRDADREAPEPTEAFPQAGSSRMF